MELIMNINSYSLSDEYNLKRQQIEQLCNEADYHNNLAKACSENYIEFKNAAEIYNNLAKTYEDTYLLLKNNISNKESLILCANLYHSKYNYAVSYGQYYNLTNDYNKAIPLYKDAKNYIQQATVFISSVLKENLSKEERDAVEYDFNMYKVDVLLNEIMIAYNENSIALENKQYSIAYDKTKLIYDYFSKIQGMINNTPEYFEPNNVRRLLAQMEAINANLFVINSYQSETDYQLIQDFDIYFDIIRYLVRSYEYTQKAIKIDNYWIDYKKTRKNIYEDIKGLLKPCKKKWSVILCKSNNNLTLIEIMKSIDNKYYNKISNKRSFFIMNIFKNHVKSKGNVVINNYSTSYTSSSDTQLSSDNIEKLNNLIDYIKRNLSNELSTDEMNCIVNNLSPIIDAKTNVQQEDAIKNWNNFKSNLSTASLKLLAISADIVTLGAFLKKLLGL
jgi:hypothetical protein